MEFGWDEGKNAANIRARQLPFELAALLFRGDTLEEIDDRHVYGEQRVRAHGEVKGRLLVCIYTDRQILGRPVRWIISLRKANKRELRKYDEWIKAASQTQDRH